MKLKEAVKWEVKIDGKKRSIQLYDANGNKLDGENAVWKGYFDCSNNQLTTLEGAPKEVGGDFYCFHNPGLTSLEGAPKEVCGGFSCSNNQLTTLEGAPKEVGGYFDCSNNPGLTSLKGAPKEHCRKSVIKRIFTAKLKRKYVFADGILQRIISTKKLGKYTIYKARKIGSKQIAFVARIKDVFAHGDSVKTAIKDLIFKYSDKDTSKYKKWTLATVKSQDDMITAYRVITGACAFGVAEFLKGKKIKDKLSVNEAIALTKGQYGSDKFEGFFANA